MSVIGTAFQFFTVLPVPGSRDLAAAVRWCPLVGLVLGGLLVAADAALAGVLGPAGRAVVLVALLAALSGALHLDGLADSADGLLAQRSPAERLAIMRDPANGGFGVAAVTLTLLTKVAALSELESGWRWPVLLVTPALARWAIVGQGALFPPARPEGGLGHAWRRGATPAALLVATLLALAPTLLLLRLAGGVLGGVVLLVALLVGWLAWRRLGGVTGDVLGATVELGEATWWLVASGLGRLG